MRIFCFSLFCFLFIAGCGSSSSDGEPSSGETRDVKKAIQNFADFYSEKEPKLLKGLFTEEPEAVVFGVGNEMWKGAANIRKKMEKQLEKVEDSNIDERDQVIKVYGTTAWFSQRGDWSYDYNGQRIKLEGVRFTGVLLNQDGKWKIAQWHTSYPVRTAEQVQQQPQ